MRDLDEFPSKKKVFSQIKITSVRLRPITVHINQVVTEVVILPLVPADQRLSWCQLIMRDAVPWPAGNRLTLVSVAGQSWPPWGSPGP